jgi:hypothetical protein
LRLTNDMHPEFSQKLETAFGTIIPRIEGDIIEE